ncbi:MAG TPA: hypothetical protein VFZ10_16175 [Geminicoccaceae bacterium]
MPSAFRHQDRVDRRDHAVVGRNTADHAFALIVVLARANTRLGLAKLVTNMRRLAWFETRMAPV